MQGKISVIIPIYNTQKYLDQCLQSVLNQKYKNVQIILINDGSTDNSLSIAKKYSENNDDIILIDKENGGLSSARNAALKYLKGEFTVFLDSDDFYCDDDFLFNLINYSKENHCDIVCTNCARYIDEKNILTKPLHGILKENNLENIIKYNIYTSSACHKLIRTELITSNNLMFEYGVHSEDIEFSARLLLYAKNIGYCEKALYAYRYRANSITTSIKYKNVKDLFYIIEKLAKQCSDNIYFNNYLAFQYSTLLINMHFVDLDLAFKNKIFKYEYLLKYNLIKQVKLIYHVKKIFGINLTSKLLYRYFLLVLPK